MREEIIKKYRPIARLPDFLFAFTFPMRRLSVEKLALQPGERALEVGCGSGANFAFMVKAVGSTGQVVGIDISPDMVAAARRRVEKHAWRNVQVIERDAEDQPVDGTFDGLLFFANPDVLTSPVGLDHSLAPLCSGSRVVAVGPKLIGTGVGKALNPVVRKLYARLAVSNKDMDQPWRALAERIPDLQVEIHSPGIMFIAWGEKPAAAPAAPASG